MSACLQPDVPRPRADHMEDAMTETARIDACPNDCGDHCGNQAWTRGDHDARTDRLRPLADHLRIGHDVLPEERRYADTWLHIALLADEWFTDTDETTDGDRRDVAAWLIREADQRVHLFPQRRDGVDALLRRLADVLNRPGATP